MTADSQTGTKRKVEDFEGEVEERLQETRSGNLFVRTTKPAENYFR